MRRRLHSADVDLSVISQIPTLNPLHQMALVAAMNIAIATQHGLTCDQGISMPWLERLQEPDDVAKWSALRRLQMEAVQACVAAHPEPEWQTLYIDELSWAHNGFDLVLRNRLTDQIKLIEVKGTGVSFKSAGTYLKATKHKGRQLSWRWIWISAMDMAEMPATAPVFFIISTALLRGAFCRELRIVRFDEVIDHRSWREMVVYEEQALSKVDGLDDLSYLDPKKKWLAEIDCHPTLEFEYPACMG